MAKSDIFVGRKKELEEFAKVLEEPPGGGKVRRCEECEKCERGKKGPRQQTTPER